MVTCSVNVPLSKQIGTKSWERAIIKEAKKTRVKKDKAEWSITHCSDKHPLLVWLLSLCNVVYSTSSLSLLLFLDSCNLVRTCLSLLLLFLEWWMEGLLATESPPMHDTAHAATPPPSTKRRPHWLDDKDVSECLQCKKEFTLLRRKVNYTTYCKHWYIFLASLPILW